MFKFAYRAAAALAFALIGGSASAITHTEFSEGPFSNGNDLGELSGPATNPIIDFEGRVDANNPDGGFSAGEGFTLDGRVVKTGIDGLQFAFDVPFTLELVSLLNDGGAATNVGFDLSPNPTGTASIFETLTTSDVGLTRSYAAGTYGLSFRGNGASARYSIKVSAIPVPLAAPMLLGAFALWRVASRRKGLAA
ncbi:MAG: hypothetical protein AAF192_14275 [Pseudomonadota bacterium]